MGRRFYVRHLQDRKRKGFKIGHIAPATIAGVRPDQYIFDIKKDSDGDVWSGGYYHLKRINLETGSVRLYPGVSSITTILEKMSDRCGSAQEWGSTGLTRNRETISMLTCLLSPLYMLFVPERRQRPVYRYSRSRIACI